MIDIYKLIEGLYQDYNLGTHYDTDNDIAQIVDYIKLKFNDDRITNPVAYWLWSSFSESWAAGFLNVTSESLYNFSNWIYKQLNKLNQED